MSSVNGQPNVLSQLAGPADLRKLNVVELRRLAAEVRELIIATVSENGGHLAPSLGVVELTLALHYAFDTPRDRIIWDVGHQSYCHKIVTGRAARFSTLRQPDGLSGFPKRAESEFDTFDTGHSGDSISVGLGLTVGDRLSRRTERTVAVVGDGSVVAGMAFEALNNTGGLRRDLVVVLNDNEMSIARSSGGFADYLNRIITGRHYNQLRGDVWNLLGRLPENMSGRARLAARKLEEGLKNLVAPSLIFEELGFRYFGPFDGHNLVTLIDTFRKVRELHQPVLVHVVTRKGKGYPPAEQHPELFHGIGRFDRETGKPAPAAGTTFTQTFGQALAELAGRDEKIVAITAGMSLGTGLSEFRTRFPDRFFDTGITEQHAVAFAAGLALAGMKPVVAVYSTFLARGFDQIVQDVCLQNLPVVFAVDRGGLVGEDGPTHHGNLDLSYLRCIPGLRVMAPADEDELRVMLEFALLPGMAPIALRYPRGGSDTGLPHPQVAPMVADRGVLVVSESSGSARADVGILALGSMVVPAMAAAVELRASGIAAWVANMRFAKPVDEELLARVASRVGTIFTVEESSLVGGFGSAVLEAAARLGLANRFRTIGLPDAFVAQGRRDRLLAACGLDAKSIAERIRREIP
jgi:1-deoxy-D-xylulose-5-phosphate synthase